MPPQCAPHHLTPDVAVEVAEGVCVILEQEVLQHSALGHEAKEVEVAAKEDVESHLTNPGGGEEKPIRDMLDVKLSPLCE